MAGNEVKDNYIIVYDWMVENLKLTGNRLIIYAIIYGFSKDDEWFRGSIGYLCKKSGASRRAVIYDLGYLVQEGLLEKNERPHKGIKYTDYKVSSAKIALVQKLHRGSAKIAPGVVQKLHPIINKDNKKIIKNARARDYLDFPQRDLDYDEIENKLISIHLDDIETR